MKIKINSFFSARFKAGFGFSSIKKLLQNEAAFMF
jgi:hypothetical protein